MEFTINKEIEITCAVEHAWDVFGAQFGEVQTWDSGISSCKLTGKGKLIGLNYASRLVETKRGSFEHVVRTFDPVYRALSYQVKGDTSFLVRKLIVECSLNRTVDRTTLLTVDVSIKTVLFFGALAGLLVKLRYSRLIDQMLNDFKNHCESTEKSSVAN